MARIVVLGGSGFLGARVVEGLRRAKADVSVASRRSPVAVDVTKPETWAALDPFDLVVDLSDTVSHPPDALIAWCLERGKTVIEATSDAPCVERLQKLTPTKGRLVLGGGIFTGVSNLVCQQASTEVGAAESITLGIASSPFSGAGKGTIELMVGAMRVPAVRYEAGARIEEPGMRFGPRLDFGGTRRSTAFMSLAEPSMLKQSTGAQTIDVVFSPKPGMLVPAFVAMPGWLVRQGWFLAFMRLYFTVLRRVFLKSMGSAVELLAIAKSNGREVRRLVRSTDGMDAGGYALAAMAEHVAKTSGWTGVRCIDQVCALEPVVARANELAGNTVLTVTSA
jgi:hypothetical protein